ncbi:MAG: hypothetical protein H6729_14565 [Deltaproteobacteria bacterium]|nr:hypothetical protein [Deltaproteobacteria bacterium]
MIRRTRWCSSELPGVIAALLALSTSTSAIAAAGTSRSTSPANTQPQGSGRQNDTRVDADDAGSITLIKPGDGFLVADGISRIPLEARISPPRSVRGQSLSAADIRASLGVVSRVNIEHSKRVTLSYAPPARAHGTDETITVSLRFESGFMFERSIHFHVPPPTRLRLSMRVEPEALTRDLSQPITLEARSAASRAEAIAVRIEAEYGRVISEPIQAQQDGTVATRATLVLTDDIDEVPNQILAVAMATSPTGFSVESTDIAVESGKRRGGGCFLAALPGQAIADGGAGPTIVIARPRPAFRGPVAWPVIHTEGATLLDIHKVHDSLRILSLDRPQKAQDVSVFLDRAYCGRVRLRTPSGTQGLLDAASKVVGTSVSTVERQAMVAIDGHASARSVPRTEQGQATHANAPTPSWSATLSGSVIAGTTRHGIGARGANAMFSLTAPVFGERLLIRMGVEITFLRSDGIIASIQVGDEAPSSIFQAVATTTITEFPVELGIRLLRWGRLSLVGTGGAGLRRTVMAIAADAQTLSSGTKLDVTARFGLEAQLLLGDVRLFAGSGVAGVGGPLRVVRDGRTLGAGSQLTARAILGAGLDL